MGLPLQQWTHLVETDVSRHCKSDIGLEAAQVGGGGVASAGLQNSPKHPFCFQVA